MQKISFLLTLHALAATKENSNYVAVATYSIVATDRETMQVGGAGASCVPGLSIRDTLYHSVPGRGVLHTQALALDRDSQAVATALEQMAMNEATPEEILNTMNALDSGRKPFPFLFLLPGPAYELRQNAIADLEGRQSSWTGSQLDALYEDFFGISDSTQESGGFYDGRRFAYSAQGNVVRNFTVTSMLLGFTGTMEDLEGEGCDLPDRLMESLQAVSMVGRGDVRCLEPGIEPRNVVGVPAAGAFLKVEAADGTVVLDIDIIGDGSTDPTIELKAEYDIWRAANPCPAPTGRSTKSTSPPDSSCFAMGRLAFSVFIAVATFAVLLF